MVARQQYPDLANEVNVTGGKPVGLVWLFPDCAYFSKARGGKPFRDRIRAKRRRRLAWVVIKWANLGVAQEPGVRDQRNTGTGR